MLPDAADAAPVPLADGVTGVALGDQIRKVQNGSKTYNISLNRTYLQQLGIFEQGAPTKHAMALRPVVIQRPAYIIQPVGVLEE